MKVIASLHSHLSLIRSHDNIERQSSTFSMCSTSIAYKIASDSPLSHPPSPSESHFLFPPTSLTIFFHQPISLNLFLDFSLTSSLQSLLSPTLSPTLSIPTNSRLPNPGLVSLPPPFPTLSTVLASISLPNPIEEEEDEEEGGPLSFERS